MSRMISLGTCMVLGHVDGAEHRSALTRIAELELEAEAALSRATKAFKTLTSAIEAEGYDVLVDVDGTYSVRRREE